MHFLQIKSFKISLTFDPRVRINNLPPLVQILVWRRPGDTPLSEPMMISLLTHICVTQPQWVKGSCQGCCAIWDIYKISQLSNHFEILHIARQRYCHMMCRIARRLNHSNGYYGRTSFRKIWVLGEFRTDIAHCKAPLQNIRKFGRYKIIMHNYNVNDASGALCLTYWLRDKWLTFPRRYFQMDFLMTGTKMYEFL